MFHFGMTGSFTVKGVGSMQYKSFSVDASQWPPKFTKCELVFDDGARLAFTNARRLGRIRLVGPRLDGERGGLLLTPRPPPVLRRPVGLAPPLGAWV